MNLFGLELFSKKSKNLPDSISGYNFKKEQVSFEERVFQRAAKYVLNNTITSPKEMNLIKRKPFSEEPYHSIIILSADLNGIKNFNGLENEKFSVVGIVKNKLFTITKDLNEIKFTDINAIENVGSHGDFERKFNLLYQYPKNYDKINISSISYKITKDGRFNLLNQLTPSSYKDKTPQYLAIAKTVRQKLNRNELENQQGMEM